MIAGTSGAGKSTLAAELAGRLDMPHIELDSLFHKENWQPAEPEQFKRDVSAHITQPRWVLDGNYSSARAITLERIDTLIWLDYELPLVLWRVTRRTLGRMFKRTLLWNGNRESLRMLLSKDSIILWTLTTHARRRREYTEIAQNLESRGVHVLRFKTPQETERFLTQLKSQ